MSALTGNAYISIALKKGTLADIDEEQALQDSCIQAILNALLIALSHWFCIPDIEAEDITEDEAYVTGDKVSCHVDIYKPCSVWSDPSVGINAATDDDLEISEKGLLKDLKEVLTGNNLADAIKSVTIETSENELILEP